MQDNKENKIGESKGGSREKYGVKRREICRNKTVSLEEQHSDTGDKKTLKSR